MTWVALATGCMWLPYTLALILHGGLGAAMGNRDCPPPPQPLWAQRAKRAHANAIENLAVFAPLTLIATAVHANSNVLAGSTLVYLIARISHYIVYCAGVPVVRTLLFFTGWVATIAIGISILFEVSS